MVPLLPREPPFLHCVCYLNIRLRATRQFSFHRILRFFTRQVLIVSANLRWVGKRWVTVGITRSCVWVVDCLDSSHYRFLRRVAPLGAERGTTPLTNSVAGGLVDRVRRVACAAPVRRAVVFI